MRKGGSIVLVSSGLHLKGLPEHGTYAATKAAVRSFARTWAMELKDRGIRVNTLSPGAVDTRSSMVSSRRRKRLTARAASSRRSRRSAASAGRKRWHRLSCSWPPTTPATAPASISSPMAGSRKCKRAFLALRGSAGCRRSPMRGGDVPHRRDLTLLLARCHGDAIRPLSGSGQVRADVKTVDA
jgi:NAD(P)-dependent dehydrogenase (short-subunit alcohol dehydrogenase family)